MARIFRYDNRDFPDPDPALSVDDVRKGLAEYFPELTNADVRQEQRGEDTIHTFSRRIGTKGLRSGDVVALLRRVPRRDLAVFDLAATLLDADGELDDQAAAAREPEIHLAVAEAQAHARATRQACDALRRLPGR